jgi:hypothetical protein
MDEEWRSARGVRRLPLPFPQLTIEAPVPWHAAYLMAKGKMRHTLFTTHPILHRLQHLFRQRFADLIFAPAKSLQIPLPPHLLEAEVDALCAEATRVLLQEYVELQYLNFLT